MSATFEDTIGSAAFGSRAYVEKLQTYIHAPPLGQKRRERSTAEKDAFRREHSIRAAENLPHTRWNEKGAYYVTTLGNPTMNIYSFSIEHARLASQAVAAFVMAGNEQRQSARSKRRENNAPKRKLSIAVHGDSHTMERRCIFRLKQRLEELDQSLPNHTHCRLELHVMCDGTLADVLYRNSLMPNDCWLQWQHKTTKKLSEYGFWHFSQVHGYSGMILVCECESEDKLWLLDGNDYDSYKEGLSICKSTGRKTTKGEPTIPTVSIQQLLDALHSNCNAASKGDESRLSTTTLREAERRIGKSNRSSTFNNHEIERIGINAFVSLVLNDYATTTQERDAVINKCRQLPIEKINNPHVWRLTNSGAFFKYPDSQNGKHDFEIWSLKPIVLDGVVFHTGEGLKTYQAKTPSAKKGGRKGFQVALTTPNGVDDAQIQDNLYKLGDADYYVAILPSEASSGDREQYRTRFWCIPEHELLSYGYIRKSETDLPATSAIGLYHDGDESNPHKCGWTRQYHWQSPPRLSKNDKVLHETEAASVHTEKRHRTDVECAAASE